MSNHGAVTTLVVGLVLVFMGVALWVLLTRGA
jgi:hypothetical protein